MQSCFWAEKFWFPLFIYFIFQDVVVQFHKIVHRDFVNFLCSLHENLNLHYIQFTSLRENQLEEVVWPCVNPFRLFLSAAVLTSKARIDWLIKLSFLTRNFALPRDSALAMCLGWLDYKQRWHDFAYHHQPGTWKVVQDWPWQCLAKSLTVEVIWIRFIQ